MAHVLGIPSQKEDMDGVMLRKVCYKEKDLERIIRYCEQDVITVTQVVLKVK